MIRLISTKQLDMANADVSPLMTGIAAREDDKLQTQ
jgi:hypothetical protein